MRKANRDYLRELRGRCKMIIDDNQVFEIPCPEK